MNGRVKQTCNIGDIGWTADMPGVWGSHCNKRFTIVGFHGEAGYAVAWSEGGREMEGICYDHEFSLLDGLERVLEKL